MSMRFADGYAGPARLGWPRSCVLSSESAAAFSCEHWSKVAVEPLSKRHSLKMSNCGRESEAALGEIVANRDG
jgi:hypothetical protein